jgi:xylulokinase
MYLGLDIGTSGVKALMIDEKQTIIATANAALDVTRPHSGWSEQNPNDWIEATKKAIGSLKKSYGRQLASVKGIGLSGQMHGATLLDEADNILRPCILWNDLRSHQEATLLDDNPAFRKISGNIVFPGFTAPKLIWVKNNESEIFDKVSRVLLPKDYLRLWLCGEYVTDPSDASGTAWFDVANRSWSDELLHACDMNCEQMPQICEGSEISGTLRKELSQEWGMHSRVVIAGGGGDNAASAVGMGVIDKGSAFVSLGTSGVIFAANERYLPNPDSAVHAFCHALPQRWHQMGVILSATDALNWFAGICGSNAESLSKNLGTELNRPGGVMFLPYLSGERTPHNDARIRGNFTGLSHDDNQVSLTQAVMEGVGYAFRDNMNALKAAGTSINQATAVGGGANSIYWLKTISTILKIPINVPVGGDFGAAFGAARLGILAAENYDPSEICTPPAIANTIEPDKNLTEAFDQAYQKYTRIYPAIKGI